MVAVEMSTTRARSDSERTPSFLAFRWRFPKEEWRVSNYSVEDSVEDIVACYTE